MNINKISGIILLFAVLICHSKLYSQIIDKSPKKIYSDYKMKKVQPNWQSADWVQPFTIKITGEKAKSENCLFVFTTWDNDSLYFFFKVTDIDLRAYQTEKDNAKLYLDDMLEVLLDTQNRKDSCWGENDIIYHVNIIGTKKDDRGTKDCLSDPNWDGKAGIKVQLFGTMNDSTDIDKGYLITLSFPWEELGVKPKKGLTMGINFANGDNDGKGRQLYDWVGAWPMRSPYAFGDLILR